ncbi:MAG: hypothetical protein J4F40_10665 [Alphaproteobacteria bacterium]|nr:hypothetical protein [Alphaproteobacteria bacterium]
MIGKVAMGALAALLVVVPEWVLAQTPREIGTYRAWRAYVYDEAKGSKVCFMDSEPVDTEPKNVRRGQIYTLVTHRPGDKVRDEVSIFVGQHRQGHDRRQGIHAVHGCGFRLELRCARRPEHGQGHDQGQRHDRRRPVQAGDPDTGPVFPEGVYRGPQGDFHGLRR